MEIDGENSKENNKNNISQNEINSEDLPPSGNNDQDENRSEGNELIDPDEELNNEELNEKLDKIMENLSRINIDKEIGSKEKRKDTRIIIDKIILENFKSYADKKIIGPLHYRFNAVVGPNGSGKSNLMESLLFVFGKRAKKMRLKRLSELIHNSSTKTNCRSAKVTVYFKEIRENIGHINEETGADYEYIEGGDFFVSREVFKNSSSRYMYNGSEINFDNLSEILIQKGIDLKHNRFLILQGEVEQIAMMKQKATNQNETGLLEFLEDIIGTTRYVPLLDKLNRAIEDLAEIKASKMNRMKLSKNELNQLEDVKNQSTDYFHKEKNLHIANHLKLILQKGLVIQKINDLKNKIENFNKETIDLQKEMQKKIDENSNVLLEHKKIKKEQENLYKQREELNKLNERYDEEDKMNRDDIDICDKELKKLDKNLEILNKNLQENMEKIKAADDENPNLKKEVEKLKNEFSQLDSELKKKEEEIFAKTEKIQKRKDEIEIKLQPSEGEINQNKFQIDQNQQTLKLLSEKFEKIETEKNQIEGKLQVATDQKNAYESHYKKLKQNQQILQDKKVEHEKLKTDKYAQCENKYKEIQNYLTKLSDLRNYNHDQNNKTAILNSLLNAQKEGKLKGIFGRLGDLGSIDQKYDCAITTACSNLDSIVVDNVENGTKALEYLKRFAIGQATFIILDKIKWVEENMKIQFKNPDPKTLRLFDLVNYQNPQLKTAFYFALRDTLVAEDMQTAMKVGYRMSPRYRVVTLDGNLIETAGTMSGGGKKKTGGMGQVEKNYNISPQEEERNIQIQYENACKEYEAFKCEYNGLENAYNKTNDNLQETLIQINNIELKINNERKNINDLTNQLNNIMSEYNKYSKDKTKMNELEEENKNLNIRNEKLISSTKNLRNELEEINNEINEIMGEDYNKNKEKHKSMKKDIEEMEKKINKNDNILKNANEILDKIKKDIESKEKSKKEKNLKIENCKKKLEELETLALDNYKKIDSLSKEIDELDKKFNERNEDIERLKQLIKEMKEKILKIKEDIKEVNDEIRGHNKVVADFDSKINSNKESYDKLMEDFGFVEEFDEEIEKIKKGKDGDNDANKNNDIIDLEKEVENKEDDDEVQLVGEENIGNEHAVIKEPKGNLVIAALSKFFKEKELRLEYTDDEIKLLIDKEKDINYSTTFLQTQINNMKPNMSAIIQYKQTLLVLKEREADLKSTIEKLKKANDIYQNVKGRRYNEFMDGFNIISSKVKEMYQLITNGGDAELELIDTLDPFSEGVNFSVRPFKKSWKVISNLSGGEKTLSSLSLIFALHHYKPSPLYVLDEIDAALDFRNVNTIADYIKRQTLDSQFLIISLRNHMFDLADRLIGIYKTFDITKVVIFNPESFDFNGKRIEKEKLIVKEEQNIKNKEDSNQNKNIAQDNINEIIKDEKEDKENNKSNIVNDDIVLEEEKNNSINKNIEDKNSEKVKSKSRSSRSKSSSKKGSRKSSRRSSAKKSKNKDQLDVDEEEK